MYAPGWVISYLNTVIYLNNPLAKQFIWPVLLVFLATVIGWLGYNLWLSGRPLEIEKLVHDSKCDLRAGPCEMSLSNGHRVSFEIKPRTIPVLEALHFEVKTYGFEVDKVMLKLNGVDMNMGATSLQLKEVADSQYSGDGGLPVCIRKAMEWEAVVELHKGNNRVIVPYRFITVKGR